MVGNAVGAAMWRYAGSQPPLMVNGVLRATVSFVSRVHAAPFLAYAVSVLLALAHPFDRHFFPADAAPR